MVGKLFIDGNDAYTSYGVVVEDSNSLLDPVSMKDPTVNKWGDENGVEVYTGEVYFEPRALSLKVAIVGTSASNMMSRLKTFFNALNATGLRYLKAQYINKGYLVYLKDTSPVSKITRFNGNPSIARFTLHFTEPYPVGRHFVTSSSSVTVTITCTKTLTVWWGDGTSETVQGTGDTAVKNYGSGGTRYIVIYGSIETIASLSVSNSSELTN